MLDPVPPPTENIYPVAYKRAPACSQAATAGNAGMDTNAATEMSAIMCMALPDIGGICSRGVVGYKRY
jgi:hypothetical protein